MNVIEVKKLTKKYGNFKALDDVTLTVQKGDIYGLVGRNGAGKTTLFKSLLGLTNQSEGTVSINGSTDMHELHQQRKTVGFLIGQNFFGYLNAHQNIEYYRKLKGIKEANETERVLKIVGLYGIDKPFGKYSMGMKQRLGIANAILGNPEIVILDEPINGLDPQGIVDIRNLIHKLNNEFGMTLIVSSHILSELDLVATRFGIIDKGVLIKEVEKQDMAKGLDKKVSLMTDNNDVALTILKQAFDLDALLDHNQIMLSNAGVTNAEIVKKLVLEGIGVDAIHHVHDSLESVYFELTGGNH